MKRVDKNGHASLPALVQRDADGLEDLHGWQMAHNAKGAQSLESDKNSDDVDASTGDSDDTGDRSSNPYAPTYIPAVLRLSPSELPAELRDRAYNYCRRTTVANLRKMAKTVGAPTRGSKKLLSTTVFAKISQRLAACPAGDQLAEWHRCCVRGDGSLYREWLESPNVQTLTWFKAPSDELLLKNYPTKAKLNTAASRKVGEPDHRALSANEYARLACIITQNEDAKRALLNSQLDRTCAQLDRSERRDQFWSSVIAPLFNSPDTALNFVAPVDLPEVRADAVPLCIRSGSCLMRSWASTRSLFTVFYSKWSASGQNNPTTFYSFLPAVPGGGNRIPVESKRALILFHVLRCGTQAENTTILDCVRGTSRTGYDYTNGTHVPLTFIENVGKDGMSTKSDRKRRRDDEDSTSSAFIQGSKQLVEAISAPQIAPAPETGMMGAENLMETTRLIENHARLLAMLRDAKAANSPDPDYIDILETQVRLSRERIRFSQKLEEDSRQKRRF